MSEWLSCEPCCYTRIGALARNDTRPLSLDEWCVLHCIYRLVEQEELEEVTSDAIHEALCRKPYHRTWSRVHVRVLLTRLVGAGLVGAQALPSTGPGRPFNHYYPTRKFEAVFREVAREFLEKVVITPDERVKGVLQSLLEKGSPSGSKRRGGN